LKQTIFGRLLVTKNSPEAFERKWLIGHQVIEATQVQTRTGHMQQNFLKSYVF